MRHGLNTEIVFNPWHPGEVWRRGVTLIEMLVAVGILVIVVLAIGVIFASTSKAVGTSQALLEMMSNARAIQDQMVRDVAAMNKDGFLVIRSTTDANGSRHDQMSFMALGSFRDPSNGAVTASAAQVWWGELAMKGDTAASGQSVAVGIDEMPTADRRGFFTLGRHATLLVAQSAGPAFGDIVYGSQATVPGEGAADITQSRVNVATITPSQVMAYVRTQVMTAGRGGPGMGTFEADQYCYRFNALRDVYSSGVSVWNGQARMMPIALQGVRDFRIEWAENGGQEWWGPDQTKRDSLTPPLASTLNEPTPGAVVPPGKADDYVAIFSFDTLRSDWPSALRVSFRLNDVNGRLQGGRAFSQVMKLPD
jgi:hypothetical protein